MTKGLIVGTGPSLADVLHLIPDFDGLIFGPNNTCGHLPIDVWLACDPAWHELYSPITGDFDKWHWDKAICKKHGYRHVEGVWMVDGKAYPRDEYLTPPAPCGGLWMQDNSRISLNHCSTAQLLNLAANQYECSEIVLIGHDFHYNGEKRHYFTGLSDKDGEYPQRIRKHSEFSKPDGNDLMAVYKRIADQDGLPPIYNATEGSALAWFPQRKLQDFLT